MTQDKARKRAARNRAQATGESYTRAARMAGTGTSATKASDVPPMALPAPVALMFARQLRAAEMHIGTGTRLAEDHGVPIGTPRIGDPSPGPLADAVHQVWTGLYELHQWADATAAASGVVAVVPGVFPQTEEEKAAERTLYPAPHQWCHAAGRTLPQPGETPEQDAAALPRVRHCLPGEVPSKRLVAFASGKTVEKALDVVPGTPAGAVWDAHGSLYGYVCQWPERGGDSPADLAAAVDGLTELADAFASAASAILSEVDRRAGDGSLIGVDPQRLTDARAKVSAVLFRSLDGEDHGAYNELRAAMSSLRGVLSGSRPALPPATGQTMPRHLSRQMAGKTVAELRAELGSEVHLQRHRSKTRVPVYDRADALQRMIQWCHATGRSTYDPDAHVREDQGTAS